MNLSRLVVRSIRRETVLYQPQDTALQPAAASDAAAAAKAWLLWMTSLTEPHFILVFHGRGQNFDWHNFSSTLQY